MLPQSSCLLDINVVIEVTESHEDAFKKIKITAAEMGAILIDVLFTEPGTLRCHYLFPNIQQAHNAAHKISGILNNISFAATGSPGFLSTYKGHLLSWGEAFVEVMKLQETPRPGLRVQRAGRVFIPNIQTEIDVDEVAKFSTKEVSEETLRHALTLKQVQPELTQKCVLMRARLPSRARSPEILKIIESMEGKGVKISLKGNLLTVVIGIENAAGNALLRLNRIRNVLGNNGISAVLFFDDVIPKQLDEYTFGIQSFVCGKTQIPDEPGIWMTKEFKDAKDHPRNRSIARTRDGTTMSANGSELVKINEIFPVDFEIEVGGPRKTIGREKEIADIKTGLDILKQQNRCRITIVEGEGGIGKTRIATDAMDEARKLGIKSFYCRQIEEDKNESGIYIRKFIEGILKQYPNHGEEFRDLAFFAEENVPDGFFEEYGGKVKALTNIEYLEPRFLKLMERISESEKGQMILDDLHWLDPFSTAILGKWLTTLEEQSGVNVIIIGREGEESIPDILKTKITEKGSICAGVKLKRLDFSSSPELMREYVRSSIPEGHEGVEIPESFLRDLARVSEGHPLCLSEILSSLMVDGKINYDGNVMVVAKDAIDNLAKGNMSATLTSLLQAKFEKLTAGEREVVDYLIAVGEVDRDLFVSLLKFKFAKKGPAAAEMALGYLDSLKTKSIIRFTPFGFTHDLLRQQREASLSGRTGELAVRAAEAYSPLRLAASAGGLGSVITPQLLFGVLNRAFQNEEALKRALTPTKLAELYEDLKFVSKEAAGFNLARNNNLNAISVIEKALRKLEPLIVGDSIARPIRTDVERTKSLSSNPLVTAANIRYLFEMYCLAAEAYIRIGTPDKADQYLAKIERLNQLFGHAQVLAGPSGLKYYVLKTKSAFASKSGIKLAHAKGELNNAITLTMSISNDARESDRERILSKGELALAEIRLSSNPDEIEKISSNVCTELEKLLKTVRKSGNNNFAMEISALMKDISRIAIQNKAYLLIMKWQGEDGDALFMQDIDKPTTEELRTAAEKLEAIKTEYESNPALIRDPQAYGYLYDTLARIKFLIGEKDKSGELIKEGIRICRNHNLLEVIARLHKLRGDLMVAEVIKGNFESEEKWDISKLRTAVESYGQGLAEISRIDQYAPYAKLCALNGAFAIGLYGLAVTKGEMSPVKKAALVELLVSEWQKILSLLAKIRPESLRDSIPTQDYLKELTLLGLLKEVGNRIGVHLPFPIQGSYEELLPADIRSEYEFLEVRATNLRKAGKTNSADMDLTSIRLKGIKALMS